MSTTRLFTCAAALAALCCGAAQAAPAPGDRAGVIRGYDAISEQTVELADHLGKWVFVDFWASWCGPCMHELPNLLSSTADLRASGRLALFSIALDDVSSTPALNKAIKDFSIDYPVIYDGGGWSSVAAKEWGVNSIPATFLLDPQGNVVATNLRGDRLRPALDYFLDYPGQYVPVGLRSSAVAKDDGTVDLLLDVSSPGRQPLKLRVDYYHQRLFWAEDDTGHAGRPVSSEYIEQDAAGPEAELSIEFNGGFSEAVETLTVPAVANTHRLIYSVEMLLPGTEGLLGGEGLWISTRGRVNLPEAASSAA